MPGATATHAHSTARRALLVVAVLTVGSIANARPTDAGSPTADAVTDLHDAFHDESPSGPRLVVGQIADVLVRVRGGAFCSGTPITATAYVVTAAHCVIDHTGRVAPRTVVRDGVTYEATDVLVDTRYFDDPSPQLDAAILVMDRVVPGPSAVMGRSIPTAGSVTLAGFQAIDSDGTLLRGDGPHDAPVPKHATGHLIEIESAPAGCTEEIAEVSVTASRVDVRCGLIPGASGGGLYASVGKSLVLVGIVSTVAPDLSSNGVVPTEAIRELMSHPEQYRQPMRGVAVIAGDAPRMALS